MRSSKSFKKLGTSLTVSGFRETEPIVLKSGKSVLANSRIGLTAQKKRSFQSAPIEELRHFRTCSTAEQLLQDLHYANWNGPNSQELQRLKAKAEAVVEIAGLPIAFPVSIYASRSEALKALNELKEQTMPGLGKLKVKYPVDRKSELAASINALFIDLTINLMLRGIEKLSTPQLVNEINRVIKKLTLYREFGLAFVDQVNLKGGKTRRWSISKLEAAENALSCLPAWATQWTPLMGIVRRVPTDPKMPLMFGWRSQTGEINICDQGIRLDAQAFGFLLLHEAGHGLHFGSNRTLQTDSAGYVVASGDPIFDFPAFCRISDWQIVRKKFKLDIDSNFIEMSGRVIALNQVVREESGLCMYAYDVYSPTGAKLWRFNPLSGFSPSLNSLASPWEDWADSFSFYCCDKAHFRSLSPEKYNYFDSIFGSSGR